MSKSKRMVAISKSLLEYELKKRGVTEKGASIELGYSPHYLNTSATNGRIAKPAVIALDRVYGIKLEDIQEPEATAEPTATGDTGLTYQDISAAVSAGVLDALTRFADEFAIYKVGGVLTIRRREDMRFED